MILLKIKIMAFKIKNASFSVFKVNFIDIKKYSFKFFGGILAGDFRFTVITAFYNTGEYLKESIESVINQDIGFEDNVQYLLVDDGSTDNTKAIALEYQELYPNNILVLSKENGGPASARNLGLKHVKGDYVNFLDSDDMLSLNSMSVVDNFFNEHDDVGIVSMPIFYFDKKEGEHHLNYKFYPERVIDLEKEYNCSQAHVSSSFIKADLLDGREFKVDLINGEDLLLINELFVHERKYGVVNSARYNYRKRIESSSIMDNAQMSERFFLEKMQNCFKELIDYSIDNVGFVPKFIQYIIALDLNGIVVSPFFEEIYTDPKDINEFWDCLDDILSNIDEKIIRKHKYLSFDVKSFLIFLKNKDFHIEVNSKRNKLFLKSNDFVINRLHTHNIYFDIVEIRDGFLCLSGYLTSKSKRSSINILAIVKTADGKKTVYECKRFDYSTTARSVKKLLGITWRFNYNFDFKIPIGENVKITFKMLFEEDEISASFGLGTKFKDYCNLNEYSNYFVKDSKIVLYQENSLHIVDESFLFKHKLELKSILKILKSNQDFKFYALYIRILSAIVFLFYNNKRIWLFMDRPTKAEDNARHLFEYSVKQNDGISKYFVVDKRTEDYRQMLKVDKNIVAFGSLKHKLLYLYAEKVISSHVNHIWLNPFFESNPMLFSGLTTIKTCFLQHGIIKYDLSYWFRKFFHNFYLFLTCSDYERISLRENEYNYSEDVVQTLGLPRFDKLKKGESLKQILFMPTWRNYLKDDESFKSSKYFEHINNFLNNSSLLNLLKDNGYQIIFKPHYDLVPFVDLLDVPKEIKISYNDSYSDLFNNSDLLITDYSSVYFDFAYLKKPVIYYRGDDKFHYDGGYLDDEIMTFGEIISSENRLIDKVKYYLENDFEMEDEYKKRVDLFFKFKDNNNSKRVYEWLLNHKG